MNRTVGMNVFNFDVCRGTHLLHCFVYCLNVQQQRVPASLLRRLLIVVTVGQCCYIALCTACSLQKECRLLEARAFGMEFIYIHIDI